MALMDRMILRKALMVVALLAPVPAGAGTASNPSTAHVTQIAAETMPGSVMFTVDNPFVSCPVYGDGQIWLQFSTTDNKPMYAAILAALLSGRAVQIGYHSPQGGAGAACVVDWIHPQ